MSGVPESSDSSTRTCSSPVSVRRHNELRVAVIGFVVIFLFCFMLGSYHHNLDLYFPGNSNSFTHSAEADFSALQAEALLQGRLDVLAAPPGLVALDNPYDPAANAGVARCCGYHDLAYFGGRIYAPQGFGAALLIDVPTRILTLRYLNPPLKSVVLVALGSWSLWFLSYGLMKRRSLDCVSRINVVLSLVIVTVANPASWLITAGRAYQAGVAAGYMGTMFGLFLTFRAIHSTRDLHRYTLLIFGSSILSLGVLARPPTVFVATGMLILILQLLGAKSGSFSTTVRNLSLVSVVCLLWVLVWGWFNFSRFESFLETGHSYQLAGVNMRTFPKLSPSFIPENFRMYLLTTFQLDTSFPYFQLSNSTWSPDVEIQSHERMVGVAVAYPILLVLAIVGIRQFGIRVKRYWVTHYVILVASSLTSLLAVSALFKDATMRYIPDFSSALVLVGCLVLLARDGHTSAPSNLRTWFQRIVLPLTIVSLSAVPLGLLLSNCVAC